MWWIFSFTILLPCINSVRIINIRVPEVLQHGIKDAVTLDCDYSTDNVTGLVVKWFFMDKSHPVYQWIPPQKPQALGLLRNKLDLSYKVSQNPYTQHRALRILSPGTELTGNYTCVVSTFLSEDERTRPMTIFVPETRFDMIQDRLSDGYLNIICSVEGVFPRPELVILVGNRLIEAKSSVRIVDARYTALTSSVVAIEYLPPTVEVLCDMQVPLANYYSRKRGIFYRESDGDGFLLRGRNYFSFLALVTGQSVPLSFATQHAMSRKLDPPPTTASTSLYSTGNNGNLKIRAPVLYWLALLYFVQL